MGEVDPRRPHWCFARGAGARRRSPDCASATPPAASTAASPGTSGPSKPAVAHQLAGAGETTSGRSGRDEPGMNSSRQLTTRPSRANFTGAHQRYGQRGQLGPKGAAGVRSSRASRAPTHRAKPDRASTAVGGSFLESRPGSILESVKESRTGAEVERARRQTDVGRGGARGRDETKALASQRQGLSGGGREVSAHH